MSQSPKQRSITEYTRPNTSSSGLAEEEIKCPVCGRLLSNTEMVARIQHVEECLSVWFIRNEQILAGDASGSKPQSRAEPRNPLALNDLTAVEATLKKRGNKAELLTEKERYLNKDTNIKKRRLKREPDGENGVKNDQPNSIKTEIPYDLASEIPDSMLPTDSTVSLKSELQAESSVKLEIELFASYSLKSESTSCSTISGPTLNLDSSVTFTSSAQTTSVSSVVHIKSEALGPGKNPVTSSTVKYRRPPIPELKILTFPKNPVENYQILVDAFSFKPHETIDKHFLSHFHSDHYGGISKKWCSEGTEFCQRIIYCTKITGKLLQIRFNIDPYYIRSMEMDTRYLVKSYLGGLDELVASNDTSPGLYVFCMTANHCPGAAIFLFESIGVDGTKCFMLHCGDFRVNKQMLLHPMLVPFLNTSPDRRVLDKVYLDTTYMDRTHNFPKQELVCDIVAELFHNLAYEDSLFTKWFGSLQSRITDFLTNSKLAKKKKRLLILVGTYVIGKEKIAISILKRLNNCPVFISNIRSRGDKGEIISSFDDEYLNLVVTDDELGGPEGNAVIHLVPMEIVGSINETSAYFNHNQYFNHFERCVGLRPSGWTFVPSQEDKDETNDLAKELNAIVKTLKHEPSFNYTDDILKQNPLPNRAVKGRKSNDSSLYKVYGLPYSEHSSYRELSFFVIFLNIGEVIPTVNTHNEWSVLKMNTIISLWTTLKNIKFYNEKSSGDLKLLQQIQDLSLDDF